MIGPAESCDRVTILRSRKLTGIGKVAWVIAVLAFPFLGSLAWFVVGRQGVPRLYRSQMA